MMRYTLEKVVSKVDVDTFIEQAGKIINKFESNPTLAVKSQREGRLLLRQFEEYLEAKGLKC